MNDIAPISTTGSFDYSILTDADLVARLQSSAERIRAIQQTATVEIGRELVAAKAALPHGRFLPWVEAEFSMSPRAAQNFMNVAERVGSKYASLAHLPAQTVYALAAPSTPDSVREAVFKRADAGAAVTAAEVQELIRPGSTPLPRIKREPEEPLPQVVPQKPEDPTATVTLCVSEKDIPEDEASVIAWAARRGIEVTRSQAQSGNHAGKYNMIDVRTGRAVYGGVSEPFSHSLLSVRVWLLMLCKRREWDEEQHALSRKIEAARQRVHLSKGGWDVGKVLSALLEQSLSPTEQALLMAAGIWDYVESEKALKVLVGPEPVAVSDGQQHNA